MRSFKAFVLFGPNGDDTSLTEIAPFVQAIIELMFKKARHLMCATTCRTMTASMVGLQAVTEPHYCETYADMIFNLKAAKVLLIVFLLGEKGCRIKLSLEFVSTLE